MRVQYLETGNTAFIHAVGLHMPPGNFGEFAIFFVLPLLAQ